MSGNRLILHADDFGMNPEVNQGIVKAFYHGLLTSTSLLSNAPCAAMACRMWDRLLTDYRSSGWPSETVRREVGDSEQDFDLGIHLNLTQGRPLTGERYPSELLDNRGCFPGIGPLGTKLMLTSRAILSKVQDELCEQIEWMCDQNKRPTHLNGHQYLELIPAIAQLIPSLLSRYSIPAVRVALEPDLSRSVLRRGRVFDWSLGLIKRHFAKRFHRVMRMTSACFPDQYFGTAAAGRVDEPMLLCFLDCAERAKLTEIGLHPSSPVSRFENSEWSINQPPREWDDPIRDSRPHELEILCSQTLPSELLKRRLKLGRLKESAAKGRSDAS